jgi:hypothetical protein
MSHEILKINVNKLLKTGLNIEQMFILDCISNGNDFLLEEYVIHCGAIDKSVFNDLIDKGYIKPIQGDITFGKLALTQKALDDFEYGVKLDHQRFFKELRDIYPKKVGKRSLHQDLAGCAKKYKSIIKSEKDHEEILKCVKLYVKDLTDDGRLQYIQLLPTWLNQKNFESYLEEARNIDKVETDTYNQI